MYGAATLAIVESIRSIRVAARAAAKASQRQRSLVEVVLTRSSLATERIILFRMISGICGTHIGRMERVSHVDPLLVGWDALLERNDPLR
jgi:hypothetical protein